VVKAQRALVVPVALLLAVLLTPSFVESFSARNPPRKIEKTSRAAETRLVGPLTPTLYAAAARALRTKDLQGARQLLDKIADADPGERASALLVAGLYAYAGHDLLHAQELLAASPTPGGALEDWRLYLLATAAAARGELDVAVAAYARLLATCPRSPLRPQVYVEAAELARRHGEDERVLALIAAARQEGVEGEAATQLEHLAWQLGGEQSDDAVLKEAGRRLLIQAPLSASTLAVGQRFRALSGEADRQLLSSGEVKQRALSFLDGSHLPAAALTTLEGVPEESRDVEWRLLKARALLAARRGEEALALLAGTSGGSTAEQASLEGARAEAALLASSATAITSVAPVASGSGKSTRRRTRRAIVQLPTAARRERLAEAALHLKNALRLGGAGDFVTAATVRQLYDRLQAAGLADPALDTLRALRRLDPADTTGAAALWERGWTAYRTGNDAGAGAAWSLLQEIYPESADAHRGLYWQARSYERTGQAERARALDENLVATSDTADFYGRQALARLGQAVSPTWTAARMTSAGPWRIDPLLARARLLTDLGLDDLAEREMAIVGKPANRRDLLALKALILGRRGGPTERAQSLLALREAFPALGTAYQASVPEEILHAYYPLEFGDEIRASAAEEHLPAWLVAGVIRQESAFNPKAESRAGARGLMQLMPPTAQEMAHRLGLPYRTADLYDPRISLRLGTAYLRELLDDFHGNLELALASYNGGPNRIERMWQQAGPGVRLDTFLENLSLDESRGYVKRILVLADSYRQLYPEAG